MIQLHPLEGTELTEYTVQLLNKRNIKTVRDFLNSHIGDLDRILHLPDKAICNIRTCLLKKHGPHIYDLTNDKQLHFLKYYTGIKSLDNLLSNDPLSAGTFWEICGKSGIGKTQFCHTVALNFVHKFPHEVLYIDLKSEFCGERVLDMMQSRNFKDRECSQVMHQIKVQRATTMQELINLLGELQKQKEAKVDNVLNIKLVIIDAIPAAYFLTKKAKRNGNIYLTKLANLIWLLCKQHNLTFITVNLSIPYIHPSEQPKEMPRTPTDNNEDEIDLLQNQNRMEIHQVLGRYWTSIPQIRLLMEHINYDDDDDDIYTEKRCIHVIKSCYTPSRKSCIVTIELEGIV